MSEELKPCPFCGGKASIDTFDGSEYRYHVTCLADGCAGNIYMPDSSYFKSGAIDAWNTRAQQGVSDEQIERAVWALSSYGYIENMQDREVPQIAKTIKAALHSDEDNKQ